MWNPSRVRWTLLLILFVATVLAQTSSNDLLLILDASGSMWARAGGEEKIVIARRVKAQMMDFAP